MHKSDEAELFSITAAAVAASQALDTTSDNSLWVRQYTEWEDSPAARTSRPRFDFLLGKPASFILPVTSPVLAGV